MKEKELIKRVKLLSGMYLLSKKKVEAELLTFEQFTLLEKRRILRNLDTILKQLVNKSDKWYQSHLKNAYKEGSSDVMKYLKAIGVKRVIYTDHDWQVIEQLIDKSQNFTYEAISGIKRATSRVLDDLTIKKIQALIATETGEQVNVRELKGALLDFLQDRGVTIKDSRGRRWELDHYAEMLARTDLMNSYNQGVLNQILHRGGDLARITSYPTCICEVCLKWENEIVSITGRTSGYPKLDDAYADGVFHPNCKHDLMPVIEEFTGEEILIS